MKIDTKRKIKSRLRDAGLVLLGAAIALLALLIVFGGPEALKAGHKLASVAYIAETEYVADYDEEYALDAACAAYMFALDDRWSYYLTAEDYGSYRDLVANEYLGVGVTIEADEDGRGAAVSRVAAESPAARAGIVPGDILTAVGPDTLAGLSLAEATAALSEYMDGGEFTLTVLDGAGETRSVTLAAENIYTTPVSSKLLEGDVGYIRIENFETGAGEQGVAAVRELMEQGAKYLLFDVRGNPGGLVSQLTELLDYLLPEGDIFIKTDREGNTDTQTSDAACVELPMAVLTDERSYSAAEYFAAALREYGVARVVGAPTTGKARSQITVPIKDGSAVHISKYAYITPLGVDLSQTGGIVPDVEAPLTEEEREALYSALLPPEEDKGVISAIQALKNP